MKHKKSIYTQKKAITTTKMQRAKSTENVKKADKFAANGSELSSMSLIILLISPRKPSTPCKLKDTADDSGFLESKKSFAHLVFKF